MSNAPLYECCICMERDNWGDSWSWYGSIANMDNYGHKGIKIVCSDECRAQLEGNHITDGRKCWCDPEIIDGVVVHRRTDN